MSTTARIAAKGCKNTGLTEDIAKTLHDHLGKTIVAVIELTSEARTETKAGDEAVKLSIGMIEIAPEGMAADHVRELARSFHYERRLAEDGPTITHELDGPEPKVADVLAAGARHRPHPFLPDDPSSEQPICDVCGQLEPAAVHSVQDVLPDDDGDDQDEDEPHAFVGDDTTRDGKPDSCVRCGRHRGEDGYAHLDDGADLAEAWVDSQHGDRAEAPDQDDEPTDTRHLTSVGNPFNPAGAPA